MDTNPIPLKARILSYNLGSFKNKQNETIDFATAMIRFDGIIMKVTSKVDLSDSVDKDVTLACELYADRAMLPKLRIIALG